MAAVAPSPGEPLRVGKIITAGTAPIVWFPERIAIWRSLDVPSRAAVSVVAGEWDTLVAVRKTDTMTARLTGVTVRTH